MKRRITIFTDSLSRRGISSKHFSRSTARHRPLEDSPIKEPAPRANTWLEAEEIVLENLKEWERSGGAEHALEGE